MGCAFRVYNHLGPFFRENIDQRALEVALSTAGLTYERQRLIEVDFLGQRIGYGDLDVVVEGQIVLELKAIRELHPDLISQVVAYLAVSQLELGILLNFGHIGKLEYRRVVLSREIRERREWRDRE